MRPDTVPGDCVTDEGTSRSPQAVQRSGEDALGPPAQDGVTSAPMRSLAPERVIPRISDSPLLREYAARNYEYFYAPTSVWTKDYRPPLEGRQVAETAPSNETRQGMLRSARLAGRLRTGQGRGGNLRTDGPRKTQSYE